MIIGTDGSGKVWLTTSGEDASTMPTEFNGAQITAHVLTDEQEAVVRLIIHEADSLASSVVRGQHGLIQRALAFAALLNQHRVTLKQLQNGGRSSAPVHAPRGG